MLKSLVNICDVLLVHSYFKSPVCIHSISIFLNLLAHKNFSNFNFVYKLLFKWVRKWRLIYSTSLSSLLFSIYLIMNFTQKKVEFIVNGTLSLCLDGKHFLLKRIMFRLCLEYNHRILL